MLGLNPSPCVSSSFNRPPNRLKPGMISLIFPTIIWNPPPKNHQTNKHIFLSQLTINSILTPSGKEKEKQGTSGPSKIAEECLCWRGNWATFKTFLAYQYNGWSEKIAKNPLQNSKSPEKKGLKHDLASLLSPFLTFPGNVQPAVSFKRKSLGIHGVALRRNGPQ